MSKDFSKHDNVNGKEIYLNTVPVVICGTLSRNTSPITTPERFTEIARDIRAERQGEGENKFKYIHSEVCVMEKSKPSVLIDMESHKRTEKDIDAFFNELIVRDDIQPTIWESYRNTEFPSRVAKEEGNILKRIDNFAEIQEAGAWLLRKEADDLRNEAAGLKNEVAGLKKEYDSLKKEYDVASSHVKEETALAYICRKTARIVNSIKSKSSDAKSRSDQSDRLSKQSDSLSDHSMYLKTESAYLSTVAASQREKEELQREKEESKKTEAPPTKKLKK